MTRSRKNAAKAQDSLLTPDNVIEIPVEEQPYPLPEGWKWVRLGDIAEIVGGGTPSSKVKEYYDNGDIPWLSPADLSDYHEIYICRGKKMLTVTGLKKSSARMMPAETVCLSSRAPIGYVVIAKNPLCTNQGFKNFLPSPLYIPKFLYWYLKGNKPLLESYASGTTFLELSGSKAAQIEFPLPPLDEQQRIVDRIESLFAKLDEAKVKAEAVLDNFEIRKASLLHKAFTGELTERWREESKIQLSSWKEESITSLCHSLKYGTAKKSKEIGSTVVLRMGNLQDGEIDWSNLAYSDDQDDIQKYPLFPNDVLFNRTNSSEHVGKTAIYRGEYPAIYAGYLIKMDYKKDRLTGSYLNYVMNSHKAKEYCNNVKRDGVNQSNINAKKLGAFVIPVPSLPEQQEIVRILDNLLAKEQQVKEAAENVLNQIELMKKAILAKAFRGELGTHVPAINNPQYN